MIPKTGVYYHKKYDELFILEDSGPLNYKIYEKDYPEGKELSVVMVWLSGFADKYWEYIGEE